MNIRKNNYKVKCRKCNKFIPRLDAIHWYGTWRCKNCKKEEAAE